MDLHMKGKVAVVTGGASGRRRQNFLSKKGPEPLSSMRIERELKRPSLLCEGWGVKLKGLDVM
jgi:hypothetical protein